MRGLDLIKKYEGLRLEAYLCPANVWTIGYGSTVYSDGSKVQRFDKINKTDAEHLLAMDYKKREFFIKEIVKVPVTENQLGALVSFAYNVGLGALQKSTLLRKLNARDYAGAADEFLKWTKAGGKELLGLVRRRKEERELFLKP